MKFQTKAKRKTEWFWFQRIERAMSRLNFLKRVLRRPPKAFWRGYNSGQKKELGIKGKNLRRLAFVPARTVRHFMVGEREGREEMKSWKRLSEKERAFMCHDWCKGPFPETEEKNGN